MIALLGSLVLLLPVTQDAKQSRLAPLLEPRNAPAAVPIPSGALVIGGWHSERGRNLVSCEIYDLERDVWKKGPERSVATVFHGAAAIGARVWVAGGLDDESNAVAVFEQIDLEEEAPSWKQLPDLPLARNRLTLTAFDGRLFAIGGMGEEGNVARVDVFDPETQSWTRGPDLAAARHGHGAVVWRDRLWVIGGYGSEGISISVEILAEDGSRWKEGPELSNPRGFFVVASRNDGLWVSHGRVSLEFPIERLKEVDGSWEPAGLAPHAHSRCGVVSVGDDVLLFGGEPPENERAVHRFDVMKRTCTLERGQG